MVVDCPVEALLGLALTLPTWKGNDNFDLASLHELGRTWARRVAHEVAALRGRSLAIAHYVPGGGVVDKPQHCATYCGDTDSDFEAMEPAKLQLLEWL